MLSGKCVVVGVCGGIAAYKAAEVVSRLKKLGADVHVIMTESAQEFVGRITFQSLSQNLVVYDMFSEPRRWEIEHVELAYRADALLVVPATANTIAKIACGIADNMLTCVALATRAPILIAPAMNCGMYENAITQQNLASLKKRGCRVIEPDEGRLACGVTGRGRLARPEAIVEAVVDTIAFQKDLAGLKILVTAGPTCEAIDPVRYITNHSSGKMGYALALAAKRRGAEVALVAGPTALSDIDGVEMVKVTSAAEMFEAVSERAQTCDIIIKAAAVGDFSAKKTAAHKIKKSESLQIALKKNPDILAYLGQHKPAGQVLVGFCMETKDLAVFAKKKLVSKNCDLIVANNLLDEGAGFGTDTNTVSIFGADGSCEALENMAKDKLSHIIIDRAKAVYDEKNQG